MQDAYDKGNSKDKRSIRGNCLEYHQREGKGQ